MPPSTTIDDAHNGGSEPGSYATALRDTKPMRAKDLSETQIQRAIIDDARKRGLFVHHSPNGAVLQGNKKQRGRQMEILKANGLAVGFPDLILLDHSGRTGFVEVKRQKGGKLSQAQEDVRDWMAETGHNWALASEPDALGDILRDWGW